MRRGTSATGEDNTRDVVVKMLNKIEAGGEEKSLEYARQLGGRDGGNAVMTREQIDAAMAKVSQQEKDDIKFPCDRVSKFARHRRDSMVEFAERVSQAD